MKILYIDQYFSTRDGNSGTRSYEFARRFVREGHQVTMLTTASRYSNLQGQREWIRRRDMDGVKVVSLRIDYGQTMGYPRRFFSFASFMIASVVVGALGPKHDLVFASSTPLSVGVSGAVLAWLRGIPFVFEVRDLWPQAPVELGIIKNPFLIGLLRFVEGWIYRRADRINALSPGMADGIAACGINQNKISMIPNASDPDLTPRTSTRQSVRKRYGFGSRAFIVVYAGAIGPANDLAALVDVAEAVRRSDAKNIRFLIVGEGSDEDRIKKFAGEKNLDNIVFTGAVPRREVGEILAAADCGVTCFAPLPVLQTCSPNKMFDYFSAGLPQMVNTPGWIEEVVTKSGAGFYWPTDKPDIGARKLIELSQDAPARKAMKAAARTCARKRFDRRILTKKLLRVFQDAQSESAAGLPFFCRRLFDSAAALAALALLCPFFIAVAMAIKIEDKGPVFYRARRVGLGGKVFSMLKFRTMVVGAENLGLGLNVASGDERITRTGRFLRDWSLDEVPQLFNILDGNMRIVGPRPALEEHIQQYSEDQKRRLRVPPGLTGWAQVNGRNALTWEKKLAYDAWYADNRSFGLDMLIIARTFGVIFRREGLYEKDAGLDDEFNRFD
jgi:lipopolysaccharide/colanic/teichoic acid biosynthesis glycosyltransferase